MSLTKNQAPPFLLFCGILTIALNPLSLWATSPPPQGVGHDEIIFGQSAALSGAAKSLGLNMQTGLLAAFS